MKMTMKEVYWRLDRIVDRRNLDMQFHARLNGHEIRISPKLGNIKKLDDNKQKTIDSTIKDIFSRKKNNG